MITHLNYIENKELRDYIYDELNKIRDIFNYIAVDEEFWGTNKSKIYAFKSLPDKNNLFWRSIYKYSQQLFYDSKYLTSSPSVYDVFNTTRDIFDIEKILENWKEDQRDNNSSEDILKKILNNFGLKINSVFQHRNNNKFFRINKHADIEEYINTGWRVTNLYEFIDIIDAMYDDDYPIFKFNVEKQFEEFKNKEKNKESLSDETKEVIKSILNTNYSFIKIHPYDNRIVLHCPTDCCPLIMNTNKETIKWFLNFIKNNTSGTKILYINRLKTFWEEEQTRN